MNDKSSPRAHVPSTRLLILLTFAYCCCPPAMAWHKSVNVRGTNNRLVIAEGGGGGVVTARDGTQSEATLTLLDLNEGRLMHDDPVSFRTPNGSFLSVGGDRVVRASGATPGTAETFIIEKQSGDRATEIADGDVVAFRTGDRRRYVRFTAAGAVVVARRWIFFGPGRSGKFTLKVLGDPAPLMLSGPFTVPQSIGPTILGVDNNPSPNPSDPPTVCVNFEGRPFPTCYKAHRGTDYPLVGSFPQMDLANLTVAAAAPGKVVAVMGGNPDHCTEVLDPPATSGGQPTLHIVCFDPPQEGGTAGFHNFVTVLQDDGLLAYYFHLEKDSIAVTQGQRVACGQLIGRIGSAGASLGPHLHFELSLIRPTDRPPQAPGDFFQEVGIFRPGVAVDPYLLNLWSRMDSPTIPAKTCTHPSTNLVSALGQSCAGLFQACALPLVCVPGERVCKALNVGLGGACDDNQLCAPGLTCRGTCKRLGVPPGGECDGNQLCGDGLDCVGGRCKVHTIPLGGACSVPGPPCESGSCYNNACREVGVGAGGSCDDNHLCALFPVLECRDGTCKLPCACPPLSCYIDLPSGQCVKNVQQTVRKDCQRVYGICPTLLNCFTDSHGDCKVDVQETHQEGCSLVCP